MEENRYQKMRREYRENFLTERRNHVRDLFFGQGNWHIQAGALKFRQVLDDETIIIRTNNVTTVKDAPVLIVGNDKAVYLKDFNIRMVHDNVMNYRLVKLQRKYFKVYTFHRPFEGVLIEQDQGFDDLAGVARQQEEFSAPVFDGMR